MTCQFLPVPFTICTCSQLTAGLLQGVAMVLAVEVWLVCVSQPPPGLFLPQQMQFYTLEPEKKMRCGIWVQVWGVWTVVFGGDREISRSERAGAWQGCEGVLFEISPQSTPGDDWTQDTSVIYGEPRNMHRKVKQAIYIKLWGVTLNRTGGYDLHCSWSLPTLAEGGQQGGQERLTSHAATANTTSIMAVLPKGVVSHD